MKKIWYLKDRKSGEGRAVKLLLYEKNGSPAGKIDLSAFLDGRHPRVIRLRFQDSNGGEIAREDFSGGKGWLTGALANTLAEALIKESGEVRLSVEAGEKRYLSDGWVTEDMTETVLPENSLLQDFPSQEALQEAEDLLTEERPGRRYVQLAALEEGLEFRKYVHNSFLLHGYYNYGHIVIDERKEGERLGVPGNYYKREQMVAEMFGFPRFEPAKETEQVKNGTFGYYYTSENKS